MACTARLAGGRLVSTSRRWMSALPSAPLAPQRRVVITGLGAVTPLGVGVDKLWQGIVSGQSGIKKLDDPALQSFASQVAGRVERGKGEGAFDMAAFVDKAATRTQGVDFIAFALAAAKEALTDAKLTSTPGFLGPYATERFGVAVGSGIGNIEEIGHTANLLAAGAEQGQRKVTPFFVPRILNNMAAGNLSIKYQLRGPNHSVSTACATGAHSIGDAFRFIKYGDADAMLAGGTEASINALSLAGFTRAKALATAFNDRPGESSRPFDKQRDGFVIGEGAGILVLEELNAARARGAPIYAEIRGYGACGDAFHITAPRDDGDGALRCMLAALLEGGIVRKGDTPGSYSFAAPLDYINAHATSTPLGDNIESFAIGRLLRGADGNNGSCNAKSVPVSSSKGAIGHLLGAAGAVEAIISILAIKHKVVPPTLNLHEPDASLPTDVCTFPNVAVNDANIRCVLKNSFGFGGTNSSLLFTEYT